MEQATIPLFGSPPPAPKQAHVREQRRRLGAGRHPLNNLPLAAGEGQTCGGCVHRKSVIYNRTYHKCALGPCSCSSVTDVRLSWPGCERWTPVEVCS